MPARGSVMSDDGCVVRLSIEDSAAEYLSGGPFSPHYAGIPGPIVVEAVRYMRLGVDLSFQALE